MQQPQCNLNTALYSEYLFFYRSQCAKPNLCVGAICGTAQRTAHNHTLRLVYISKSIELYYYHSFQLSLPTSTTLLHSLIQITDISSLHPIHTSHYVGGTNKRAFKPTFT